MLRSHSFDAQDKAVALERAARYDGHELSCGKAKRWSSGFRLRIAPHEPHPTEIVVAATTLVVVRVAECGLILERSSGKCMRTGLRERSAKKYREKFEEMKRLAKVADESGDEAARRSYEKLAEGWHEMVKHAERHGRLGT